jgi:tRNA threonylcarbamoyladenosine biosynthesis protein TsaB
LDGRIEQVLETAPRRHGELILGMMQQVLENAGTRLGRTGRDRLRARPGILHGVRIAVAVAQGAAFGAGLPLVPVSTWRPLPRAISPRRSAAAAGGARCANGRGLLGMLRDRREGSGRVLLRGACVPAGPGRGAGQGGLVRRRTGLGPSTAPSSPPEPVCRPTPMPARRSARLGILPYSVRPSLPPGATVPPELAAPVYLRDRVTRVG